MRSNLVVLFLAMPLTAMPASAADQFPQVDQYTLDATFFPDEARMIGRADIRFVCAGSSPDSVVCYLHGELSVDSAQIGGRSVKIDQKPVFYEYDYSLIANQITLPPGVAACDSPLTLYYSGFFHASNARSPSDYMRIDHDGVYLRAYYYSPWFPVFVRPGGNVPGATFDKVTIHTPSDLRSVFTGRLLGESVSNGQRVTEWAAENTGLAEAQCTAQRYAVSSEGNCWVYSYPDSVSLAAGSQILEFTSELNKLYGKYYRKGTSGSAYYVIEMPPYGDISSGNVTGLMGSTWKLFADDTNAKRALAHELVHPYTAVPVDRADPLWCLAIEGFPSYFHLPVLAEVLGSDVYDRFIDWTEKRYLEKRATGKTRRGPVPPEKPLLELKPDELSTYKDEFVLDDRALLLMNYIYRHLGRKRFFNFTSDLFNRKSLSAQTFRQTVAKYLPNSTADVNLWLDTTEYPERFQLDHLPNRKK